MSQIRIAPPLAAAGAEVEGARGLVDVIDAANHPLALRDLVLQRALVGVVQIEMAPAVAFGRPDHLAAAVERSRQEDRRVDERRAFLLQDGAGDTGRRVDGAQANVLISALDFPIREAAAVSRPL